MGNTSSREDMSFVLAVFVVVPWWVGSIFLLLVPLFLGKPRVLVQFSWLVRDVSSFVVVLAWFVPLWFVCVVVVGIVDSFSIPWEV